MSKILIIAPKDAKELDDVVKMLSGAGHEVAIEEPTPRNLLHIVLGLFTPNAFGFGDEYFVKPSKGDSEEVASQGQEDSDTDQGETDAKDVEDKNKKDSSKEEEVEFKFESLGTCLIDGVEIDVVFSPKVEETYLQVTDMVVGPKTFYMLGESLWAIWPDDENDIRQSFVVKFGGKTLKTNFTKLVDSTETKLVVGQDNISFFK